MRINLTKKDLVNLVYMQLGFSKQISENLIDDFLSTIVKNIKSEKKLKIIKIWYVFYKTEKIKNRKKPQNERVKSNIQQRSCSV